MYEHSVCKSHLEAIAFVTSIEVSQKCADANVKSTAHDPKQKSLLSYFGATANHESEKNMSLN